MTEFLKIVKFLLANACGFYVTPVLLTLAVKFRIYPQVPQEHASRIFEFMLTGGMWSWIAGGLLSIGFFFIEGKKTKRAFLAAPALLPAAFCVIALAYLIVAKPF